MEPMKAGLITSEVVGVSPTEKSFRVVHNSTGLDVDKARSPLCFYHWCGSCCFCFRFSHFSCKAVTITGGYVNFDSTEIPQKFVARLRGQSEFEVCEMQMTEVPRPLDLLT